MTVLIENDHGWFIDCKRYFDSIYMNCVDKNSKSCRFEIQKELFNIKTPFLMNSSAVKLSRRIEDLEFTKVSKKKKKKKKYGLQSSGTTTCSYIESLIENTAVKFIKYAYSLGYLDKSDVSGQEWFENNIDAREAAKTLLPVPSEDRAISFENQCDASVVTSFHKEDYLIPAGSLFFLSDVSYLAHLKEKFDLILLDPPWENKSVKRKKGYQTLSMQSLLNLPIEKLCNPECLIVIWLTNKKKQVSFVREELFKKWNVESFVLWHWLKVTQKGKFVYPIDSLHKKPYENILLGYVRSNEKEKTAFIKKLDPHKVIVSVPSSIHSQKPPLVEILKPYLPHHPKCLEVFARYLLPGWTSIGNEVIKLQNMKLFEHIVDKCT